MSKKNPIWEKRARQYTAMANLYRKGWTLREIGQKYGCSRENVRQHIRGLGITRSDAGWLALVRERKGVVRVTRDARSLKKWGCTTEQYVAIRALRKPTRAFASQQQKARKRGITWNLTLWEWWSIWTESGKWAERGNGADKYVMCRIGDIGPYAVGNVFIATGRENLLHARNRIGRLPANIKPGTPEARILRESQIYWWTSLR